MLYKNGTATKIKSLKRPVAGKTGTTNNYVDAWFIGYTPELVTGVWVGKDKDKPLGRNETWLKSCNSNLVTVYAKSFGK